MRFINRFYLILMIKKYFTKLIKVKNLSDFIKLIIEVLNNGEVRFLLVGFYNTLISYVFGLFYFRYIEIDFFKIIYFNIIITFHSFISHKFLSFKKSKFCFKEFLRAMFVYLLMYLFSAGLILFLLKLGFSQLLAYHINLFLSLYFFYFLHTKYTFK